MKFSLQFKTLFSLRAFLSPYARAWNPYFFRFIVGKRYKYAVIDTNHFSVLFKSTFAFLRQTMLNGGKYYYFNPYQSSLFVTHAFGLELSRWVPGVFTNKLAMRRIRSLSRIPFFFPSALFLLNLEVKNVSFAKEAKSLLVPTIAIMGAYFNHQLIDYPLLGNSSARLSTFILDVTKQMYNALCIDWALDYSFNRYKYVGSKAKSSFLKKEDGLLVARSAGMRNDLTATALSGSVYKFRSPLKKGEFLSLHFRSFRYFSARYKRFWNAIYRIKDFYNAKRKQFKSVKKYRGRDNKQFRFRKNNYNNKKFGRKNRKGGKFVNRFSRKARSSFKSSKVKRYS